MQSIIAEVRFDSRKRKKLPRKGYRPDIIVEGIADSYWGIIFLELEAIDFDIDFYALITFTFQSKHFEEIALNQKFYIMEGSNQVGYGTFLVWG